eukprot:GHVL01013584.1.p1 GENE.GHVL01013584.1~~GHVL01013584.1.p1  ORF type:complete len:915 (+),score=267.11 GHVL01013584.1:23-2767(+)
MSHKSTTPWDERQNCHRTVTPVRKICPTTSVIPITKNAYRTVTPIKKNQNVTPILSNRTSVTPVRSNRTSVTPIKKNTYRTVTPNKIKGWKSNTESFSSSTSYRNRRMSGEYIPSIVTDVDGTKIKNKNRRSFENTDNKALYRANSLQNFSKKKIISKSKMKTVTKRECISNRRIGNKISTSRRHSSISNTRTIESQLSDIGKNQADVLLKDPEVTDVLDPCIPNLDLTSNRRTDMTPDSSRTDECYTPDINNSYTPDVNNGYTPDINNGYTPEVNNGYTPEVNNGYTPDITNGYIQDGKVGYNSGKDIQGCRLDLAVINTQGSEVYENEPHGSEVYEKEPQGSEGNISCSDSFLNGRSNSSPMFSTPGGLNNRIPRDSVKKLKKFDLSRLFQLLSIYPPPGKGDKESYHTPRTSPTSSVRKDFAHDAPPPGLPPTGLPPTGREPEDESIDSPPEDITHISSDLKPPPMGVNTPDSISDIFTTPPSSRIYNKTPIKRQLAELSSSNRSIRTNKKRTSSISSDTVKYPSTPSSDPLNLRERSSKCHSLGQPMRPPTKKTHEIHSSSVDPHSCAVLSLAVSPDGHLLASGASDGSLRMEYFPTVPSSVSSGLSNALKKSTTMTIQAHSSQVTDISLSLECDLMLTCGSSGSVHLWCLDNADDLTCSRPAVKLKPMIDAVERTCNRIGGSGCNRIGGGYNRSSSGGGCSGGVVRQRSGVAFNSIGTSVCGGAQFYCKDAYLLVAAGNDLLVYENGFTDLPPPPGGCYNGDRTTKSSVGGGGGGFRPPPPLIHVLRHENFKNVTAFTAPNDVTGSWVVAGGSNKSLCLWDVSAGKCLPFRRESHKKPCRTLRAPPGVDFKTVLSAAPDDTVKIWDIRTLQDEITVSGQITVSDIKYNGFRSSSKSSTKNSISGFIMWD